MVVLIRGIKSVVKKMANKNLGKTKGKRDSKGEKPPSTAFHIRNKTIFLTYKGISEKGELLTRESLANFLATQNPKDRTSRPVKYHVCKQTYEDGSPHYHVILVYSKIKSITSPDHYDYLDIHPNIQGMRNMKVW